jgi:TolA-binding protein
MTRLRTGALVALCLTASAGCAEWFAASEPPADPARQAPVAARPVPPPERRSESPERRSESPEPDPERVRLQQDLARLTAEIAELQNALARLTAAARLNDDRLDAMERRMREREASSGSTGTSLPPRWQHPGPSYPASSPSAATAEDLLQAGRAEHETGNRDAALLKLHELIVGFPDHPARERAQLLVADIYYEQRDYRAALAQLDSVMAASPAGPRTAETLLRVGLCRRALGDEAAARQSWERVLKDYPTSDAATRARQLLRAGRRG